MDGKDLKVGETVWAKMKGFCPWPALVCVPHRIMSLKSKKPQHLVFFLGTHDFAKVLDTDVVLHSEEQLKKSKLSSKKSSSWSLAMVEVEDSQLKAKFRANAAFKLKQLEHGKMSMKSEKESIKKTKKMNHQIEIRKNEIETDKIEANKTEMKKIEVKADKIEVEADKIEMKEIEAEMDKIQSETDKIEMKKIEANKTEMKKIEVETDKIEMDETEANKTEMIKIYTKKIEPLKIETMNMYDSIKKKRNMDAKMCLEKPVSPSIKTILVLKSKPISVLKPKPISVLKPKLISVLKPKPISLLKPKPILLLKPKPISLLKPKPISLLKPKPISLLKRKPISVLKHNEIATNQSEPAMKKWCLSLYTLMKRMVRPLGLASLESLPTNVFAKVTQLHQSLNAMQPQFSFKSLPGKGKQLFLRCLAKLKLQRRRPEPGSRNGLRVIET